MKIGLSIYSLWQALKQGELTPLSAIQWIADNGGEHFEIVEFVLNLMENDSLIPQIVDKAKAAGVEISAYCTGENLLDGGREEREEKLRRLKAQVDIAHRLGTRVMRCDLSEWGRPPERNHIEQFEQDLPCLVACCRELADYAAQYGITITVENHGTYINGGDRVRRLILAVDRKNYRCTLDVGNALCVDEDPLVSVDELLPLAVSVHFKDFYVRHDPAVLGAEHWLTSNHGNYLRGAIVGHGEIPVDRVMKKLKEGGYDGYLAVEFEGMEDCKLGSKIGMENLRRLAQTV